MPGAGFEPAIPESEGPQTHVIGRAVTGIGPSPLYSQENGTWYPLNRRCGVGALEERKILSGFEIDSLFVQHPSHYVERATPILEQDPGATY